MSIDELSNEYCHFLDDDAFVETERAGFRRRVVTGEQLQMCFWRIAGGATGSYLHCHDHNEQLGIVVRGGLDFRIGEPDDERRVVLGEGDVYLAPCNVWHGDSIFLGDETYGECWIIDVFAPPRDDLRNDIPATQSSDVRTGADDAATAANSANGASE